MDFASFVQSVKITEVTAKSRSSAMRKLARATQLEDAGIPLDELVEAIEEREAAAQTVVAPGFAVPHAFANWSGDFRAVLGRSRAGIDYETAESGPVHLVLLLVVGAEGKSIYLQYLATLAEFFGDEKFRAQLVAADDTQSIARLIHEKVGLVEQPKIKIPRINRIIFQEALEVVPKLGAQAVLAVVERVLDLPWATVKDWAGRLLVVTPDAVDDFPEDRPDTHLIEVPRVTLSRTDRANLGILLSSSKGLLVADADVVCVSGADRRLDTLTVVRPEPHFESMFGNNQPGRKPISPAVILRALTVALELAEEGREGKSIGTMFVIGDSRQVVRHTQQLVLNPFHGYAKSLRSILDPSLGETIKEFALLDGAFIIQADGMVLSAGTYVIPKSSAAKLQSGLGTRHQAAASITSHTAAMVILVSQSTGTVVAFRQGKIVLKLERSGAGKQ